MIKKDFFYFLRFLQRKFYFATEFFFHDFFGSLRLNLEHINYHTYDQGHQLFCAFSLIVDYVNDITREDLDLSLWDFVPTHLHLHDQMPKQKNLVHQGLSIMHIQSLKS